MKKIYMLTLDDEVPLSANVNSDIREIAYLLYSELQTYEKTILCDVNDARDYLILNELHDIYFDGKYFYKFTSDNTTLDYRYFEPFMVGNKSFGFTVYDGAITDDEIMDTLNYLLRITNLDYKFKLNSLSYDENYKNSRFKTIDMLVDDVGVYNQKINDKKYTKKKIKPFLGKIAGLL